MKKTIDNMFDKALKNGKRNAWLLMMQVSCRSVVTFWLLLPLIPGSFIWISEEMHNLFSEYLLQLKKEYNKIIDR